MLAVSAEGHSHVARILREPEIAALVAARRSHDLYDLIRVRRAHSIDPAERSDLDAWLADRRWFFEPVERAPTLLTVNFIGTMLYGATDARSDGTYIATQFVVVFFFPIWPLAEFIVRGAGGRKYSFFGKVPLRNSHRIWRRLVVALAAAAFVALVIASLVRRRS
jgi:hypothetical protein